MTGFSPFTLLFGREVKGPLELLRTTWLDEECDDASVGEWLLGVRAKMAEMSEIVSDREKKAKSDMKRFYDRSARVKSFEVGEMVLVRKPGLQCKLGDFWEGPYQIEGRVSPVTYRIQVPGKPQHSRILHCNLLRKWTTPAAKIHRVAILEEDEGDVEASAGLTLVREDFAPSAAEQARLDRVLDEYSDVLTPEPGKTDAMLLRITRVTITLSVATPTEFPLGGKRSEGSD